jgi:hypothetical protein
MDERPRRLQNQPAWDQTVSVNSKLTDNAGAKGRPTIMRLYGRGDNQGNMVGAWIAG